MSTYRELAAKAGEAERRGKFGDAAAIWSQAFDKASGTSRGWAITRFNFCVAANKNGWGAWS